MTRPTVVGRRRRLPALLLLVVLAASVGPGTGVRAEEPATAEEVRQRTARILGTPGYQTTLPADGVAEPPPERRPLGPLAGLLTRIVFWLTVIGVVVLLLKMLIDAQVGSTRNRPPPAATPDSAGSAPPDLAPTPLPDADALAREGRFGEAVHALLLAALAHLSDRRGAPLPSSLTSREVLALGEVDGEPRRALGELVTAVERFLFAGRPLAEADWERCRSAFRDFRVAGGGVA